jgi:4-amino-4-deoxy-L-arabinose transferase-like glycosyltransferase
VESRSGGGLTLAVLAAFHDARWVIAFALVVFGAALAAPQIRGDSIVYAAVSKNLVQSGDPMHLTLNDEPYSDAPPLFFWITATVMSAVGTGPIGAKLGALIVSVGLCVMLYRSLRRVFDDRVVGMLAVFVFAATYGVYRNTTQPTMESLVALCAFASLMCFWRWLDTARLYWIVGWGSLAGLGMLAKGLVGTLPLAAGLVYMLVRERKHFGVTGLSHLSLGLLSCAAVCAWWFVAQGSEFTSAFLGGQIFDRGLLGNAEDAQRWWLVYPARLLSFDLLWMATALIGVRHAWPVESLRRPVGLLLVAAGVHLILIHLIEEKSARHLYQLYPFTAGLSAFGILSLKRFDAEHLLKIVIVVFAIGIQFIGVRAAHDEFAPMREAVRLGEMWQMPVVSSASGFPNLDERGAFDYYLADHVAPLTDNVSFIAVRPKSEASPWARTLFASDRVWTGLVLGGTEGPGEAFPMTDAQKGSP